MVIGFLEGSAPALPKNFSAHQGMCPKVSSISGVPGYCPTEKFGTAKCFLLIKLSPQVSLLHPCRIC
jgi:hypothetical protein